MIILYLILTLTYFFYFNKIHHFLPQSSLNSTKEHFYLKFVTDDATVVKITQVIT